MIGQSLWMMPDPQLTRDVSSREHTDHTVGRGRRGGVDRRDVGAGVVGQVQCAVEHPRHAQVVDVVAIPERQLGRLVLGARCADARTEGRLERLALGDGLDGVEDLHVPGAAAEVGAEVRSHRRAIEVGALLVDLRLGPHDDARDAEAALQATAGGERVGEAAPLIGVDALEGHDRRPGDLGQRQVAADHRLAVDEHRAAPALPRRRAPVLRRRDVELLAQRGEQMGVVGAHGHRRAVDRQLDRVTHWCTINSCDAFGPAISTGHQ